MFKRWDGVGKVLVALFVCGMFIVSVGEGSNCLQDGLVAHYPFNAGDNLKDKSGKGNDGIVHGGANLVIDSDRPGKEYNVYNFNGTNGYIEA
ncbi:hypothetical protein MBAV_001777, partial [Candidatus Magnetobacterium bavaricum]